LIVGAGPAGAACALSLKDSGLSIAVLDKEGFPRDKTCGDALSVDVINQLHILSKDLASTFLSYPSKTPSFGVKIHAPDHGHIEIPFIHKGHEKCGYICTRADFDNLLFQHLKSQANIFHFEHCRVNKIEIQKDSAIVHTSDGIFIGKIIVGADGAQSVVAKQLKTRADRMKNSAGLRVYYEGVTSFHKDQYIELYFMREILPGYVWVFPLPDNKANVGIGMLTADISRKGINLKETLATILMNHPQLKERFRSARPLETAKGFGLPLGSGKQKISGERFLLTGDAASLIDPFSGEGIGNALRSGRVAAQHVEKCFTHNNFSALFNLGYDREIYDRMWKELRISKTLQRLARYPWLFNFVVRKANQNNYVRQMLIDALAQADKKKLLALPGFYYRLFFKSKGASR